MPYRLLPLRFDRINVHEVFVCNEAGEFLVLHANDFSMLVNQQLTSKSSSFLDLKAKQFLTDTELEPVIEMLATKYRTKKSFLDNFTALHMVVPTLKCNSNCKYCQVSRKDVTTKGFTMNKTTARRIVDLIFKSPSPCIKIEFQGGEPLLEFRIIKYIIEYAEWVNLFKKKDLEFVICTNLTLMTDKMLRYLKGHRIYISTSLDGPKDLHNMNRPLQNDSDSYNLLIDRIKLCRNYLGNDSVSALMTTTRHSLSRLNDVVDEYLSQGFNSIFIRSLNPYGFAKKDGESFTYKIEDFINAYKKTLNYIIDINLRGTHFVEGFATLLLTRILTPFSTGFVDMQSPAGVAISGVIYNYDGNVYVSDEARMLASTGDKNFLMGNVNNKTYPELFNSEFLCSLISKSCLECLPECSWCAYQSFCGADPVRNYSEQGDIIGNRATSEVCKKNKEIIKFLLDLVKNGDQRVQKVFWSWITRHPISPEKGGDR